MNLCMFVLKFIVFWDNWGILGWGELCLPEAQLYSKCNVFFRSFFCSFGGVFGFHVHLLLLFF